MARTEGDGDFLELGLLLIVTGMVVGLAVASLLAVLARKSVILSSWPLTVVVAAALLGVLTLVFLLVRRVRRFVARR